MCLHYPAVVLVYACPSLTRPFSARSSQPPFAMERAQRHLALLVGADAAKAAVPVDAKPVAGTAAAAPAAAGAKEEEVKLPVKWNGWGFDDTELVLNQRGQVELTGSRYLFSGRELPSLRKWMEENAGLNVEWTSFSQPHPTLPEPVRNEKFLEAIKGAYSRISFSSQERLLHVHGHTAEEMFKLKFGKFDRTPDVVVWPESHEQCEVIVKAAQAHDVVLIPYGGGTSVAHALIPPADEKRMIVSIDMHCMNRVKWINKASMMACIECGAVGRDIEQKLAKHGLVLGHEPDSVEFSTLGGWIATRASGMRKNRYGNIEDIIVHTRVLTPTGTLEKGVLAPRISAGPDMHHVVMGSEGSLGLVTEAVVRLRPKAECTRYGSIIFPNFEQGVACMHEIALKRAAPVSIRLMDNVQFQFGQALKPGNSHWLEDIKDKIKKWYVLNRLKFVPETMTAATLLFEGDVAEVNRQEANVYEIAGKYGGVKAGEENGIRGYFLTYMIAYLRDFGFNYRFIAESFETSVKFENIIPMCAAVKERIYASAKANGVKFKPFVSCRVTQLYDTGACVYFYFGFVWQGVEDPVKAYTNIEHDAREEIISQGGSVSHHHGIGKIRAHLMEKTVGSAGVALLHAVKHHVDPKNIFGVGNLGLGPAPAAH